MAQEFAARGGDSRFDFSTAFSRTVGWLTRQEQEVLRSKRVAIAGLGGAGGSHLMALTRLGVGAFHLADPDVFELVNFNRQAGATLGTIGRSKVDVLSAAALQINPTLDLRLFPEGVDRENLEAFFDGVDVYVDGLDFFAMDARRAVFAACARRGIPAVTVAPLGMTAALLTFLPGRMTFEEYFRLEGLSEKEQLLRFLVGLAPARLHTKQLVDPSRIDLGAHRGPSTPMACGLCAAIAGTEVVKILLGRGDVLAAPRGMQVDLYGNRTVRTFLPWGNANPLQRLALAVARRRLSAAEESAPPATAAGSARPEIEQILDLARWAPSGDNTQPWTFELAGPDRVIVRGRETGRDGVYDLDGRARQLAMGTLLETLTIAASAFRRRSVPRLIGLDGIHASYEVRLPREPGLAVDPLAEMIPKRRVQRGLLRRRALTGSERRALEAAVAPDFEVRWLEEGRRWDAAVVNFRIAGLRLALPEAYAVHRDVVEWGSQTSLDRIPDRALGLDRATLIAMRWVMKTAGRARLAVRSWVGILVPRLEMDLLPGLFCAAHFALVARRRPENVDDQVAAGRAVQRFWLTATQRHLQLQPSMAPLIFRRYVSAGIAFTGEASAAREAAALAARMDDLLSKEVADRTVFFGRIGSGKAASARSLRQPLDALCHGGSPA